MWIVEWIANELQKVFKKLGEKNKVFKGFRISKKGGHKHCFTKPLGSWNLMIVKSLYDFQRIPRELAIDFTF